jgi:hypothetical protein
MAGLILRNVPQRQHGPPLQVLAVNCGALDLRAIADRKDPEARNSPSIRPALYSHSHGGPPMHILMLVVLGLVVLAVFFFGARLLNRSEKSGATAFIWIWLVASIINGAFGVTRAGIPIINEIGAFVPIFGVPAALAWYLAYRYRS